VTHKVLIVDDSKLARMAVVKALNALHPDWIRAEASNAVEALEHISQGAVNIILLDFNMPGKDGLVLAAELRETHPDISVAVISANHQVEVVRRAEAAGATFLPKPLTVKALGDFLDIAAKRIQGAG
jgi:DNA-binding NarL/FixJ family response regulator